VSVERCAWKRCRSTQIALTCLGKPLCERHWLRVRELQERGRDAEARQMLGLRTRGSGRQVISARSR